MFLREKGEEHLVWKSPKFFGKKFFFRRKAIQDLSVMEYFG